MKHALPTTLLAAGAALLAGAAQAEDPVKIGVPVGLSGANSVVAPSVVQSAELAVAQINAAGGLLGRPVELVVADDGSGAAGAQRAFDSLIFSDQVDALISMQTSAARNAGLPILSRGNVPYIYTSFYEGGSCHPNMFVNAWVPEQQVPPVVDHFQAEYGAETYFLIGSDYSFGRGMLEFTREYIEAGGGEVVGEEYLPMDGTDWAPIISNLRSSEADAVITSTAGGAPNVTLTRQLRDSGVDIPYANLAVDEGTAGDMGDVATGIYISASYITGIESDANAAFLAAMEEHFADDLSTPNELSVPQYEGILAYAAAVEATGSTETAGIIEALAEVSVDGPRGTIVMDHQRHAPLTMYLGRVVEGGDVELVTEFDAVSPGEQCPDL